MPLDMGPQDDEQSWLAVVTLWQGGFGVHLPMLCVHAACFWTRAHMMIAELALQRLPCGMEPWVCWC